MYYGFIVYSLRETPAVLRHCIISGEDEEDTVLSSQQFCADHVSDTMKSRRRGHCKSAGGCTHRYVAHDIKIRDVVTIPTSLLPTVFEASAVVSPDYMRATISVLAAFAAHKG